MHPLRKEKPAGIEAFSPHRADVETTKTKPHTHLIGEVSNQKRTTVAAKGINFRARLKNMCHVFSGLGMKRRWRCP